MAAPTEMPHSYGPTCVFYDDSKGSEERESSSPDAAPRVKAQFFYTSYLPIDDPLSPLPAISTSSNPAKVPPQPYSARDNAALEEAWLGLQKTDEKKLGEHKKNTEQGAEDQLQAQGEKQRGRSEDTAKADGQQVSSPRPSNKRRKESSQQSETTSQTANVRANQAGRRTNNQSVESHPHVMLYDYPEHHDHAGQDSPIREKELAEGQNEAQTPKKKEQSPSRLWQKKSKLKAKKDEGNAGELNALEAAETEAEDDIHHRDCGECRDEAEMLDSKRSRYRLRSAFARKDKRNAQSESPTEQSAAHLPDDSPSRPGDTSGKPFARAPSRSPKGVKVNVDGANDDPKQDSRSMTDRIKKSVEKVQKPSSPPRIKRSKSERAQAKADAESPHRGRASWFAIKTKEKDAKKAYVPVGVSRLHLVEMPTLQMKPIYWNPIHDISSVLRGTWFYKSSMLPVEPEVAILLEVGYEYMRPWTSTWQDELNSCVKNGAEAELKVVHRLWPKEEDKTDSRPGTGKEPQKASTKDIAQSPTIASVPENQAAGSTGIAEGQQRLFKNSSVIYVSAQDAQILRPSLLPSVSRGRKPLSAIRAGREIGVAIVRGFDRKAWEKLHPPKQAGPTQPQKTANISQSGAATTDDQRKNCEVCEKDAEKAKVTDLILVIHGIGQKLSERVESFHFTHAINAFRRQVNVELASEEVKPHLRPSLGGVMVLPVNWRSTVDLDDGEDLSVKAESDTAENNFTLKDITPESLPAVRNLISDVMLDIPYYLSHHKPKMIQAVIKEANRIYRLWCRNNPDFHEKGRVHLIAHSLGSAMAMDILSKQPTKLPKELDLNTKKVHGDIFEFDTKNLFFCGSPAGFFLLLNKAHLVPRRGREKPGADGEDQDNKIVAELGTYGSLAIDNLYNVMHYNDPIAYRVNPAVDTDYASSLKPMNIPSSSSSWFSTLTVMFRNSPAAWSAAPNAVGMRPQMNKMPSTIEMETHDFTREEIAEKRMLLLNDNGQLDYVLSSGGGPLEIQYLNMLSAHSSYWILQDFVRFLVVECGREPGKGSALGIMRAQKKGQLAKR